MVDRIEPDVVVLAGWLNPAYVALAGRCKSRGIPTVMTMDTPYRGKLRQRLARFRLFNYLRKIDHVVVPGERAWQFAMRLGFSESRVHRGMYGVDFARFAGSTTQRAQSPGGWPKKFLFLGRYCHVKAIDVLLDAYSRYRERVEDPWTLTTCGSGELAPLIDRAQGVDNRGFVQPEDLPAVFAEHAALVLPSRFEPWGQVIVEACGAGLPVICSQSCGSAVELVRPYHNGLICATDDAEDLARKLIWAHENAGRLPAMGRASQALGQAYSASAWADRWTALLSEAAGV